MIARSPMRPTSLKCPAPAMPATSVPNSSGAISIRIMRMKIWLNGRMMFAQYVAVASSSVLM
jgi:hypothetical protein